MIEIIDNFFPSNIFSEFSHSVKNIKHWVFHNGTALKSEKLGNFFFAHDAIGEKYLLSHISKNVKEKSKLDINPKFLRCNLNLTTFSPITFQTSAHVDSDKNHYVLLIYMNETDGDTIIYDDRWEIGNSFVLSDDERAKLNIAKIVSPEPNKCLIFHGSHYHSYWFPKKHNSRIVINCNFIL